MRWSPDKTKRVFSGLDSVERSVIGIGRVVLRAALLGVLAVIMTRHSM